MKIIKELSKGNIEEYMEIYLNAYPAYKTLDSQCYDRYKAKTLTEMSEDTDVDFFGMFVDGKLAATMKLVSFSINLYGKIRPATGLMALGVHPMFRKQGLAKKMIAYFEEYAVKSGSSLAVLLPFNFGFYRKLGYGFGSRLDEYTLATENLPKGNDDMKFLRYLGKDDIDRIINCQSYFAEQNHGMMKLFDEEMRAYCSDTSSRWVGYEAGDNMFGFMSYHYESLHPENYTLNRIVVDDMTYKDSRVLRAFLGFLRNQSDNAQQVVLRTGEENFYHLLTDPQNQDFGYMDFGYLETNRSGVGVMYKIVNLDKFIEDTAHRNMEDCGLMVGFDLGEGDGITLVFLPREEEEGNYWATCDNEADVTITCDIGTLSSLLMNAADLKQLVNLGVAKIDNKEYLDELDRVFHYYQKPWSNNDF